jgi:hypothetical protein
MYIEMNRSFQAQYRANRFHKPTQTIGVKIMNVKKIRAQVAQLNEGKIVSLVNNSSLLLSVKGIKTDADRRIVKGLLLNRLTKIRAASAAMADNTVHQRRLYCQKWETSTAPNYIKAIRIGWLLSLNDDLV